ncbi:hypothetical protein I310_02647 [Cryptococcus deuterogattii CA1014]|nr:hypothetical protein I310_02647 [Cryptococcus deuterogattii CA1014]
MNLHFKIDEINESARTDLAACKDLGKAEAGGWMEDMARVQWSAQRLAQGKEGQADEAKTREKPYEELDQMLVQSDEFVLALTWLKEALKRNDAETAIKEAETAKYIAEKQHSLKQKIAAKARNENDLKSFCRVHQALGVLQQAVIAYDRAVGSYVDEFGSDHPPQKALSVKAVLERKPDDLFWFKSCSIQEMSHGPRTPTVRKAFKRYSTGTVFMKIATPSSRNSPTDSMDLRARWEITGRFQAMGFQAVGVGTRKRRRRTFPLATSVSGPCILSLRLGKLIGFLSSIG